MLLALYGADVIKVEPPEGDWSRGLGYDSVAAENPKLLYLYLSVNFKHFSSNDEGPHRQWYYDLVKSYPSDKGSTNKQ